MLSERVGLVIYSASMLSGCLLPEIEWSDALSADAGSGGGMPVGSLEPEPVPSSDAGSGSGGGGSSSGGAAGSSEPGQGGAAGAAGNGAAAGNEEPGDLGMDGTPGSGGNAGSGNVGSAGNGGADDGSACNDGRKNGAETGVDCGGGCGLCGAGKECSDANQCQSGVCGTTQCDPVFQKCCEQSLCSGEQICTPGIRQCSQQDDVEVCNECGTDFTLAQTCTLGCLPAENGASCLLL